MEMPEPLKKMGILLLTTGVIWLSVGAVSLFNGNEFVRAVATLLALVATLTVWTLWALNEYGIGTEVTPGEKAKRAADGGEDPRLALLLSLFTPDERDTLRARLTNDLEAEGESVSLADLLGADARDHRKAQK